MEEVVKPYGYIYLTTNLINGKGYIGKHSISHHNPNYLGSGGRHFQNALNKYGRENFSNEVMIWCFSEEELNAEEEFLIDFFDCVESESFYNEREGGKGGWGKGIYHVNYGRKFSEEARMSMSRAGRGRKFSDEHRRKISEAHKGKVFSDEHRKKMSDSIKRKYLSDDNYRRAVVSSMYGRHHSEESKKMMSESHKGKRHSEEARKKMSEASKGKEYHLSCRNCNNPFIGTSSRQKYCDECKELLKKLP